MGNRKLEHCRSFINIIPSKVSETTIVERKQNVGVGVIQSFDTCITTTRILETIIAPNIDVARRRVLIGSTTKLGSRSSGVSVIRNLS